jgi:Xaa-Pro dipeptidase
VRTQQGDHQLTGLVVPEDGGLARLPLSERDRRYKNVRDAMRADGIDVLVLPANHTRWDQMMADSRYLTTIGGYGTETLTVFPLEGEVTAGVFNRAEFWKDSQDWVSDVRDCTNRWAELITKRLHELKFPATGCIGISGLGWLARAADGIVPYATVTKIKEAFPKAKVVDASDIVLKARAVKSDLEVGIMRHSVSIIEKMIDAMAAQARPGIREKELYATLVGTMLSADGESPSLLIFGSGPPGSRTQFVPTNRVLAKGDIISGEIQANYCGYSGQVIHPVSLGTQSQSYMDQLKAAQESLMGISAAMEPGNTMGDLMDTYEKVIKGIGNPDYNVSHPMMHARGLGDEFPYQTEGVDIAKFREIPLVSGMVFVVKPRVRSRSSRQSAQIGETIVVRPGGGERLGRRALELRLA